WMGFGGWWMVVELGWWLSCNAVVSTRRDEGT
ncbi:MAG: hypothetical protein ACI8RZ_006411, partial [Myxococcota bacterium]